MMRWIEFLSSLSGGVTPLGAAKFKLFTAPKKVLDIGTELIYSQKSYEPPLVEKLYNLEKLFFLMHIEYIDVEFLSTSSCVYSSKI